MSTLNQMILEIENDLSNYKDRNMIDRTSLRKWFFNAVRKFGQTVTEKVDTVIDIKDGKGCLPEDFQSIVMAYKCTPLTFDCDSEAVDTVVSSLEWKETTERTTTWKSCEPCCKTETEKVIVENTVISNIPVSLYYSNPTKLKITRRTRKDFCDSKCSNYFDNNSQYEIEIDHTSIYTNFSEGTLFIRYNGIAQNEDGEVLVPYSPQGKVATYLENHLKAKLFAKFLLNGDDENLINKLNYLKGEEKTSFEEAIRDAKFGTLTPSSYKKLALRNKLNTMKVEYLIPSLK